MKVLHFVTGGFSGATHVVIDLLIAQQKISNIDSLLVLRQKKNTTAEKLKRLEQQGINYHVITGSSHLATIVALKKICETWRPDILVAHGFPEHLIGRWAGKKAKIPHLIQVEHASKERYTAWRLWQSRHLSQYTDMAVGVSQGVANVLKTQQLHCPVTAIANGIDTKRFFNTTPLSDRPNDIVMVARFSKGKNHAVLIQALSILNAQGKTPHLTLLGSGSQRHQQQVKQQVNELGLQHQVQFLGHTDNVAKILGEHKICVLASYHEGMSLSVIEAMAAGCVMIGSDVIGIQELIDDGKDGFLFPVGDAQMLTKRLAQVLSDLPSYQKMVNNAQQKAIQYYDNNVMAENYRLLFEQVLAG